MNKRLRKFISIIGSIIILVEGNLIYKLNIKNSNNIEMINSLLNDNKNIEEELRNKNNELESKEEELRLKCEDLELKIDKIKELEDIITDLNDQIEDLSGSYEEIKVELTGYCNCHYCSGNWGGITAMGTHTRVGVIAAPQSISLGSQLSIPDLTWYKSDGIFDVEDRGGAVQQKSDGTYIIDVWFPTHEQALEFGRKTATAYILK